MSGVIEGLYREERDRSSDERAEEVAQLRWLWIASRIDDRSAVLIIIGCRWKRPSSQYWQNLIESGIDSSS